MKDRTFIFQQDKESIQEFRKSSKKRPKILRKGPIDRERRKERSAGGRKVTHMRGMALLLKESGRTCPFRSGTAPCPADLYARNAQAGPFRSVSIDVLDGRVDRMPCRRGRYFENIDETLGPRLRILITSSSTAAGIR